MLTWRRWAHSTPSQSAAPLDHAAVRRLRPTCASTPSWTPSPPRRGRARRAPTASSLRHREGVLRTEASPSGTPPAAPRRRPGPASAPHPGEPAAADRPSGRLSSDQGRPAWRGSRSRPRAAWRSDRRRARPSQHRALIEPASSAPHARRATEARRAAAAALSGGGGLARGWLGSSGPYPAAGGAAGPARPPPPLMGQNGGEVWPPRIRLAPSPRGPQAAATPRRPPRRQHAWPPRRNGAAKIGAPLERPTPSRAATGRDPARFVGSARLHAWRPDPRQAERESRYFPEYRA